MATPANRYEVRAAQPGDAPAINAIYNEDVLKSTATFDTEASTLEEREAWLKERQRPYGVLVAERDGEVTGWAAFKAYGGKPAYRYTVENAVYVREDARGQGVGRLLLGRLLEVAAENGFHTVIARIALPNEASVALHEGLGFRRVGLEREVGYKFERRLDVMVMQRMLGG